jgi:hypothetical protein
MRELTPQQEAKVNEYLQQFNKNVAEYEGWNSATDCSFGIYVSDNPNDQNITLIMTVISGISDSMQTYKATNNIMIEPNGISVKLTDVYPRDYVLDYIQKLKKIN